MFTDLRGIIILHVHHILHTYTKNELYLLKIMEFAVNSSDKLSMAVTYSSRTVIYYSLVKYYYLILGPGIRGQNINNKESIHQVPVV